MRQSVPHSLSHGEGFTPCGVSPSIVPKQDISTVHTLCTAYFMYVSCAVQSVPFVK